MSISTCNYIKTFDFFCTKEVRTLN